MRKFSIRAQVDTIVERILLGQNKDLGVLVPGKELIYVDYIVSYEEEHEEE